MFLYTKLYEYLNGQERSENNRLIDYTKISDSLNSDTIKEICKEAENNNFYGVTVLPEYVALFKSFSNNNFKISAVIDFPKGESGIKTKIKEIDKAIINGANEIDVVLNYNMIKNSDEHEDLENEIREITEFCHRESVIVKATIEIGALNYQELESICEMCVDNNVDFITTSTGKLSRDESFESKLEKVIFMRKILPDDVKIKFTGGIRTNEQINQIKNLVERIGTSIIPS